jgi:hypothetical protein
MTNLYDPGKPLIFMHVPKCGGVSVQYILKEWFGCRYIRPSHEGFRQLTGDPRLVGGPSCIHEHFSIYRNQLEAVYPGARQLFTVLRDPFDMLLSLYSFGLQRAGPTLAKECGSLDAFLDRCLQRRDVASLFSWLPKRSPNETLADYANRFMLIGTTDRLSQTMDILADAVQMPRAIVETKNKSSRHDIKVPDRRDEFRQFLANEYALYEMARDAIDAGQPLGWGRAFSRDPFPQKVVS